MKHFTNIKICIGVVALIFLLVISYFFTLSNDGEKYNNHPNEVFVTDSIEQDKILEANVPEGSKTYMDDENKWQRGELRITFTYPSEWTVNKEIFNQKLTAVTAMGDGYSFRIDQNGRGMPRPYDYTQVIGGYNARVWKETTDSEKQFTFGIVDIDFIIHVTTPNNNEEILDQILSSVVFYK